MLRRTSAWLLAVTLTCGVTWADEHSPPPALRIGDRAPTLSGATWVQGDAVRSYRRGRIYVLDFFGLAPQQLAHVAILDELAERRADNLDVIGVASGISVDTARVAERVEWFGDDLRYRVCADPSARLRETLGYASESDRSGYPGTMIVDQRGRLAWIGTAADPDFERCLDALLDGTWDLTAARDAYEAELVHWRRTKAQMEPLFLELLQASSEHDAEASARLSLRIAALHPHYEPMRTLAINALFELGRPDDALRESRAFLDGPSGRDPFELASLAETLIDAETLGPDGGRARDLALLAIERAMELASLRKLAPLTTLASVHAARGDWELAVEHQAQAVANAPPGPGERYHRGRLAEYREALARAKALREPSESGAQEH